MDMTDIGGGSGSAKGTETKKPASWADFPDYEKFWGAFVDTFFGIDGGTPYHEMLREDIEWLKNTYLQNNESLTQLENEHINALKRADYEYEEEIKGSQIPISFGGGPTINLLPKSSQYIADTTRGHTAERLDKTLELGGKQAERIMDYGKTFTPNKARTAHMEYLRQLGTEGQSLRQDLPITSQEGSVDRDTSVLETLGTAVELGKDAKDLYDFVRGLWD